MIKKIVAPMALISFFSAGVFSDSVRIVTEGVNVESGGVHPFNISSEVGFAPTKDEIKVKIAGKVCTMGSSTQGSVPRGCNYSVVLTPDGAKVVAREASDVCKQIPMTCG